jgi:predicted thioesterase
MSLEPGLKATVERTVTEADTARALGSGDLDVFGTPAVVAACEEASVLAVRIHLDEGQTTVGTRIELDHLAPTPVGRLVTASAVLDGVDGRSLTFTVSASDQSGEIARGSHMRVIVGRERFLENAASR